MSKILTGLAGLALMGAEQARQRAEQALERRESLEDAAAMQAALSRSMVRLRVAESMRRRRGSRANPPR